MKKVIMSVAMVILSLVLSGCGSKQESLVKEFYSVIQSNNPEKGAKFAEEHFTERLDKMLIEDVEKAFEKIRDSKDSPKIKVLQEHEEGGVKYMALEVQCAGTTMYFGVTGEKFEVITTKREFISK